MDLNRIKFLDYQKTAYRKAFAGRLREMESDVADLLILLLEHFHRRGYPMKVVKPNRNLGVHIYGSISGEEPVIMLSPNLR